MIYYIKQKNERRKCSYGTSTVTRKTLYRSAGVREYWIVDPMKQTIMVYDMEHDSAPAIYSFTDSIKANIYDDLWIDFQKLDL